MAQKTDGPGGVAKPAKKPEEKEPLPVIVDAPEEPKKTVKKTTTVALPSFGRTRRTSVPLPASTTPTTTQKEKFWETEGFKNFLQSIHLGGLDASTSQDVEASALKNTELPSSPSRDSFKKPGKATLQDVETRIRQEVRQSLQGAYVPPGTTRTDYDKVIEQKVKERMDSFQKPRYVFMADGTPFYLDKKFEREDYMASIQDQPTAQRIWSQLKYDIPSTVGKLLGWLGEPAYKVEERITGHSDPGDVFGPLISTGYNAAILGWEYIRSAGLAITPDDVRRKHIADLEQLKLSNPAQADLYQKMIDRQERYIVSHNSSTQRIEDAQNAIMRSWAEVNDAREWIKAHPEIAMTRDTRRSIPDSKRIPYDEALANLREQAKLEAQSYRNQAATAYRNRDFASAVELTKKAQDGDRRSQVGDPYGAYTWVREPEREQAFLTDVALLELQKGSPLSLEEIRRAREYHANAWTELGGQFIFDPLNLVPAKVFEAAFKLPGSVIKKSVQAVSKEFPVVGKTLDVLGSPIRWLKRQSVSSAGNQIARETHYVTERIIGAYASDEAAIQAMDRVSNMVMEIRRAATEPEARTIFQTYQESVDGLRNITFADAKKLADASQYVPPATWGKVLEDALQKAEGNRLSALDGYAGIFRKAYMDPHRVVKGGAALDDTLSGWVSKTLRNLSGDEINDALKANGFDKAVARWGETLKPGTKQFIRNTNRALEFVLTSASWVRDQWTTMVLSTPRWLVNNMIDTSSRAIIGGQNVLSDLTTLFTHTQRQFADELGIVPLDITQSLARMDLDFTENVTTKLLSGDFKPNAGVFSYWAEEYRRLRKTDAVIAKQEIMRSMLSGLPDGKLKNALFWTMDGIGSKLPTLLLDAVPGAIADANTAIEFTFRLRMLHGQYFRLLDELEPVFVSKGMDALSPAAQEIAKQIWKESRSNPARIKVMVDELLGKTKQGNQITWSFLTPGNLDDLGRGMDPVQKAVFVDHFRASVSEFIQSSTKAGRRLSGDEIGKFVDDYAAQMKVEIQEAMAQTSDLRLLDGTIRKDGIPNPVPELKDIQGAAPKPLLESPQNQTIAQATSRLRRNKVFKAQSSADVADDFSVAVSDFASVRHTTGDQVRMVMENGKPVIEIGDNALKIKSTELYDRLHNTLIDTLKATQADNILRGGFGTLNEYDSVLRKFMGDKDGPVRLLVDNEKQFATIVDQFTKQPQIMDLLKRTAKKEFSFDAAVDIYRHFGSYSDVYGFDRPIKQLIEEMSSGKSIPTPGYYSAAAREEAVATSKLSRIQTESPVLRGKLMNFMEEWGANRSQLHQYRFHFDVNPLQGSARSKAWETVYYAQGADDFLHEAQIKNALVDMFAKDPVAAEQYLDDALADFPSYFLKENGIEVVWDANHQKILEMTITKAGKRTKVINEFSRAAVQDMFYSPLARKQLQKNPILQIAKDGTPNVHRQLSMTLRDTFKMPDKYASGWASVIENHARRWANETGQDVSAYYERLGFQRLEKGYGLGTLRDFRVVKGGAVSRLPDGGFMFYGLDKSDFESVVRETGELFFDDLNEMARYSDRASADLKTIRQYIETRTKSKIAGNRLNQAQSEVFTDIFTRYVARGVGPDIKLKGAFERFKGYLSDTFSAVRDTPLVDELSDDVYRSLNGLFVESQMRVSPIANVRQANLMAKEAGLNLTDDDLLKFINDTIPPVSYDEIAWDAWKKQADLSKIPATVLDNPDSYTKYLDSSMRVELSKLDTQYADDIAQAVTEDAKDILRGRLEADKLSIEKDYGLRIRKVKKAVNFSERKPYANLGEVPARSVRDALLKQNPQASITIDTEIQAAWDTWKTQRGLSGFQEDALRSPDSFKAYLKKRMDDEWSEASWQYNRLYAETEHFEDALMSYRAGGDMANTFSPRIPEYMLGDGMKTWIRNNEAMISNYEGALNILDGWKPYLQDMANGVNPLQDLTKTQIAELSQWAVTAANSKAELIDLILKGGTHNNRTYEGAINYVNRNMIDYQTRNVFDQFMRNLFPFWMFPSRSIPFWVETLATHPQMIAGYEKLQRMSRTQRYQAGAVTSQGKPLPSMDGYIQIPGADLWINPLAPLSFRYVLDIWKTRDDVAYQMSKGDDMDPKAFVARELMETSQIYGFSMAPWMSFLLKQQMGVSDEIIPRFPLTPQISLIPRWAVLDMIHKANKVNVFGVQGWGEALYPEANWHDYLVERQILENSLMQLQEGNLTEPQKVKLRNEMTHAIKEKKGQVWDDAYKQVTTNEAYRNWGSFFTGIYAKPFTDGQAEMLRLRNEMNLLKSSLNNEFQTSVFNLPSDAETAYRNYTDKLGTDEGWVYRLYTDAGFVKTDLGNLAPAEERNKWLAIQIEQDEKQALYYQKSKAAYDEYNKSLRALPIGSDFSEYQPIYDRLQEQLDEIASLKSTGEVYFTNKPVELIERDLRNEYFKQVVRFKPRWDIDSGETYDQYRQRVLEWEARLPEVASYLVRAYQRNKEVVGTLGALREDQQISPSFFNDLLNQTNTKGVQQWQVENDDVMDALNAAWKATYWDAYWDAGVLQGGYRSDVAELDFLTKHPQPPNADELYGWIRQTYGDRFSLEEIQKYAGDVGSLNIEERRLQGQADPEDYAARQDIWDMLSWVGPGSRNRAAFESAFTKNGGDLDALTVWYEENGQAYTTQPDKLKRLHDTLKETMQVLDLQAPSRTELVEYVQAQDENTKFRDVVSKELGDQFFDWTDENGQNQQGLFGYYNSLPTAERKKFRKEQSDLYLQIKNYYKIKDAFAESHPVWGAYYGFETEPTVAKVTYTPATYSQGQFTRPQFESSARPAPVGSTYEKQPYFGIRSRIPSTFPADFTRVAGSSLMWEINNLYSSGRHLSRASLSFLRDLGSRHPEWSSYIDQILTTNSR